MFRDQNNHPWEDFLDERARVIVWMSHIMKYSDKEILYHLVMDETQVRLIREYMEKENV